MRIVNLVENTEGEAGCGSEHGLSFYIETNKHKLLMDTGQTDLLLHNAQKLGIDLTQVDTVVLSHGHYDHGGGILPFSGINHQARIYVPKSAFGRFYSLRGSREPAYIGLAEGIRGLPQVVTVDGELVIDEELSLFSGIGSSRPVPLPNRRLKVRTKEGLVQDDFRHEQCLVIRQDGMTVLLSGCAHHGILNVLERYRALYGAEPDVVISGFHTLNSKGYSEEEINQIKEIALELRGYSTEFYTGHCTGVEPYQVMKELMGDKLHYVHSGDEIRLRS